MEKTIFTDEKIFKLQASNNNQNDIIYQVNLSDIKEKGHSEKRKLPVSLMVSAGVFKLGKTSIYFVTPGAMILQWHFATITVRDARDDYIFKQGGARSHTSKVTLAYLEEHCCKFLNSDFWSPNRPLFLWLCYLGYTGSQNLEA